MRLRAAATCRHWLPAAATWFPQAPWYARGFWPQVAAGRTKWRRVATSCIGPRAALVCVCAFEPPPLVATGRQPPPLGFPRLPSMPGGSGLKWRQVAPSGGGWPPVASVLGQRLYAYGPLSRRHLSPLVASHRHLVSPGSPVCQGGLASSGGRLHQVAAGGDQLKLPSDELNCRSKRRFSDLTSQDCIFRSRK